MKQVRSICVCGAGTMGSGIAQAAAQAGYITQLYDLNPDILAKSKNGIESSLQKLEEKGKLNKAAVLQKLSFHGELKECKAELYIEAIVEKPAAKISLFHEIATFAGKECILASNTSSLSISGIAEKIDHAERVVGMHFFNPATIMKLVEVVRTHKSSDEVIETIVAVCHQMGKTAVVCKDSPGFIVNRVARPYYIESLRLAENKISSFESTDELLEASGFKMGPFRLMDLIGNDINYAVSCSVFEQLGNPDRLEPSFIQQELVAGNKLGKKSGEGYYKYTEGSATI